MNAIEYTPTYVLQLQKNGHKCQCSGCHSHSPLLQLRWKNQVRNTAILSCDRAAAWILCSAEPLRLHTGEATAENLPEMAVELQKINQSCLWLLETCQSELNVFLYTLGVFISRAKTSNRKERESLVGRLLTPAMQQQLMREFMQMTPDNTCKLKVLRALSNLKIRANIAGWHGERLAQKLAELQNLSAEDLQARLVKLEREMNKFKPGWQKIFKNFLFYEFYHNLFPGSTESEWEKAFANLCQHVFSLKMLCAIAVQLEPALSDECISALFAAYQREAIWSCFTQDFLPSGYALLLHPERR